MPVKEAKSYATALKITAKTLFLQGYSIPEIAAKLTIGTRSLYAWKKEENWVAELPCNVDPVELKLAKRLNALADRENKSKAELDEYAILIKSFGSLSKDLAEAAKLKAQAIAIGKGIFPPEELKQKTPSTRGNNGGGRSSGKEVKNDISSITEEKIEGVLQQFFAYQKKWWAERKRRLRFILKSRQIGATYYFAFEALADAILTGKNKIFLSASRDQAEVFKAYIIAFAKEHFELELKGSNVITLSNGAELRFLSTNSRTAQSYHGDLYIDEVFWLQNFKKLYKIASGMASHKKWTITLFSTPSVTSHTAYKKWSGEEFNEGKADKDKVIFDVSHEHLKDGVLGADNIWRHIVTIEDAEKQGCDLFDIPSLKLEYNKSDWGNLFLCLFIDDAASIFSLTTLQRCMIEKDNWDDYDENLSRPFGNRPVALGYDPSRTRDSAVLVLMAIPLTPGQKWRVLKTYNYSGQNFQYQASCIREVYEKHNVQHIGIDTTGIGIGVFELVEQFYRLATPINYSIDTKTRLVVKAIDVIDNNRFSYLEGEISVTQSLMINKTSTSSGAITYAANRNVDVGHADYAWAIFHALAYEQLVTSPKTTVY
jgi:uncharacterized protein YjcR